MQSEFHFHESIAYSALGAGHSKDEKMRSKEIIWYIIYKNHIKFEFGRLKNHAFEYDQQHLLEF